MTPALTDRCFLDISDGKKELGRITVQLFSDVVPKTCANFMSLCSGDAGIGKTTGKPLHYKGCKFHRVIKNFMIQSGDFSSGTGQGGESIYGGQFDDENFHFQHSEPFMLSMANRGKNTNGSQFFITTKPAKHLDGVHVAFGKVIAGHEVVVSIEDMPVDKKARPLQDIIITDCGLLPPDTSCDSASGSEVEKRKKRVKKHKKDKKQKKDRKDKKEKKKKHTSVRHSAYESGEEDEKMECSIDPSEIPEIPSNKFLLRGAPDGDGVRSGDSSRRYHNLAMERFEGRKVKGRGALRFTRNRSRSQTPPHWRREQERLRPLSQRVEEKRKELSPVDSRPERRHSPVSPAGRDDDRDHHPRNRWRSRSRERQLGRRDWSPPHRRRRGRDSSQDSSPHRKHEERNSDVECDFDLIPKPRRLQSAIVDQKSIAVTDQSIENHKKDDKYEGKKC